MKKEIKPLYERIEEEFGPIDTFKALENETVLGTIDEIPCAESRDSLDTGYAKATITDKRLIIGSQVLENDTKGRFTFYYETWLNKIEDIKLRSYDTMKGKGFILGIVVLVFLAAILVAIGVAIRGVVLYGCCAGALISLILCIPFFPTKKPRRVFELVITTSNGNLILGNTKESDLFILISMTSVEKLTLLMMGIRKAQHIE